MKGYTLPFIVALAASAIIFLLLDVTIMRMMGLTLIYQP